METLNSIMSKHPSATEAQARSKAEEQLGAAVGECILAGMTWDEIRRCMSAGLSKSAGALRGLVSAYERAAHDSAEPGER